MVCQSREVGFWVQRGVKIGQEPTLDPLQDIDKAVFGDRYDWTTGAPHDGNEWKKYHVVPRAYPSRTLRHAYLIGLEAKGRFAFQGRRGIASVERWNLRPVIFGVEIFVTHFKRGERCSLKRALGSPDPAQGPNKGGEAILFGRAVGHQLVFEGVGDHLGH